jgi:hypothetical protein
MTGPIEPTPGPWRVVGESRWPMAIAVLVLMATTVTAPSKDFVLVVWVIAGIEGVLLAALIIGDPGRIDRRSTRLTRLGSLLVAFLIGAALLGTAVLIFNLVTGGTMTNEPIPLLIAGGKVWLTNNIAFAMLYWQFDGGGPAERAHGLPRYPDFAFPQLSSPDLAPPDWRPQFVDYLYIGFTTANAFSPTDTLPLTPWAKVAMASQALISFVIVGLVIARAVNVFT